MKLLALALFIALAIAGCQSANVAFNDRYEGDDFMLNYEYGDGNLRDDITSKYYIVEFIDGVKYPIDGFETKGFNTIEECELARRRYDKYTDDIIICTLLKKLNTSHQCCSI